MMVFFAISHDAPAEEPNEAPAPVEEAEPQDIFASSNEEASPDPAPEQTIETVSNPTNNPDSPFDTQRATGGSNYAQRRSGGRRDFSARTGAASTPDFFNNAMAVNEANATMRAEEQSSKRKKV